LIVAIGMLVCEDSSEISIAPRLTLDSVTL
jgi:hypothetical protein